MKMKKWIALALSAALCFTLLSSCSRPSTSGGSSPAPAARRSLLGELAQRLLHRGL